MATMRGVHLYRVIMLLLNVQLLMSPSWSLPLFVRSRWIVDEAAGGSRIKLSCVNWVSHLQPMVAEGLSNKPLSYITHTISSLGFNCVRLTWATFMFTDPAHRDLTVAQSLNALNLRSAAAGINANNPGLMGLSIIEAYKQVVAGLGEAGLMVILDNHISQPQWCCGGNDGNGFFGDEYFDPQVWIQGLSTVASIFKDSSHVVAMSLRNELRGPRSNPADWYKYMQQGAKAVHGVNPNVLIILSGLNYDSDLKFLASQQLALPFMNKIVYEVHWYSFSDGQSWSIRGKANQFCGSITSRMNDHAGFLAKSMNTVSAPLFISEFGIDERGGNRKDNRYINCFLAFAAEGDFDWSLWTLPGSYYIRNGQPGFEETYGVFNRGWDGLRNPGFISRLKPIQNPIQDPHFSVGPFYQIIYHPASGHCLQVTSAGDLVLGSCSGKTKWAYNGQQAGGPIGLLGTSLCIGNQGNGEPATLTSQCSTPNNAWHIVSSSKLQIATASGDNIGNMACLDGSSSPSVVTSDCICVIDSECSNDDGVESQWFKVITSNRKVG